MNPVQHFEHLHQALNPTLLSASANGAAHFKSSSKQSNSGGGLISASSWRIGEAIVQKQLKQHIRQQKQHIKETAEAKADDFKPNEAKSSGPKRSESTNNAQNNHSPYSNRTKRTECHLVQETPSNRAATGHSKAVNTQGKQQQQQQQHSNVKSVKSKSYQTSDLQNYIDNQKKKRSNDLKSEKEKQSREKEERKKKLEELYRKQRSQAVTVRNQTTPEPVVAYAPTLRSQRRVDNSKFKQIEDKSLERDSSKNKLNYEQDMSKVLLLNDNDKLVEKRKQQAASNKYEYNEESQSLEDDEGDDDDEDADDQELDQEKSERKDEENNSGSSATLTPSSSHIVAATTTTVAPAEMASGTRRVEYKHDRLYKHERSTNTRPSLLTRC